MKMTDYPLNTNEFTPNVASTIPTDKFVAEESTLSASGAQSWLANASEELTFQFSEKVEALKKSLEQRMEHRRDLDIGDDLKAESVRSVQRMLRVLEGGEGLARLRERASILAQHYLNLSKNPDPPPWLDRMDPVQRYGVMRLTLDHVSREDLIDKDHAVGQLTADMQNLYAAHQSRIDAILDFVEVSPPQPASNTESARFCSAYFNLLQTEPTARQLFDMLIEFGGKTKVSRASWKLLRDALMLNLSTDYPSLDAKLFSHIAATIGHLTSTVRTMLDFSIKLPDKSTGKGATQEERTRLLFDIAGSSAPASLIDKLASSSGCPVNSQERVAFFNALLRQVREWPVIVWATTDGNKFAVNELQKRLTSRNNLLLLQNRGVLFPLRGR